MENTPLGNKNARITKLGQVLTEVPYGVYNLRRSFEQRRQVNFQEAQYFLTAAKGLLPEQNPYFKNQEDPVIKEYVASGFHNSCWKFETSKGIWVIKIGHSKSPMQAESHPSSEKYSKDYRKSLDVQRSIFSSQLPNLIPEPQEVLYGIGKERTATIVIQPFITAIMPFNKIKGLSLEHQENLKHELEIFLNLCKVMRKQHGITPDIIRAGGKKGHFIVAQKEDGPHLVMLDNGAFDKMAPTPLFNFLNNLAVDYKIPRAIRKIK